MANTVSNNRISNFVNTQVPFFVRNDHQNFVKFLEYYYEYLEQDSKLVNELKLLKTFQDIDLTEDVYADKLYSTFLKLIPIDVLADKTILIKHIKDFYRAKGTEKSVKFLFNVLYNLQDISFYYPKKDILRASDGKWFIQKSLRITDTVIDGVANTSLFALEKYIGTTITGNTSNASAIVESIDRFFEQGTQIDELILSNIKGSFDNGETVFTLYDDTNEGTKSLYSNIFSGIINTITITNAGTNYNIGDHVIIVSNTGSGACATVAQVSTGNIASISILNGGAGYQNNDYLLITGGGGSGANGQLTLVLDNNSVHPNSYNLVSNTIDFERNTVISNAVYSNLNSSVIDPANNWISNSMYFWTYANTGPAVIVKLNASGSSYSSTPTVSVIANTRIQSLGILGRMRINDGGSNYQINDKIEFINVFGGYGTGASANVKNVNGSGAITEVEFEEVPGHIIGGSGYDINFLPTANVITSTGNGANISVTATLGAGASFSTLSSSIGSIERIVIYNRGSGYTTAPTIDLSGSGDGTAQAVSTIVTGAYSYPGRYLNDDGHVSSYNFLQDRDYYQLFSYVVNSSKSIHEYRDVLKNLTHPAGSKLFGRYIYVDDDASNMICSCDIHDSIHSVSLEKEYEKIGNTINVSYTSHSFTADQNVTLEFVSWDNGSSNTKNGIYRIETVSTDNLEIIQKSKLVDIEITDSGWGYSGNGYLEITGDGYGANASYTVNSNGAIISVSILEPGINFTYEPSITANATNTTTATFSSMISYANNSNGNVIITLIS